MIDLPYPNQVVRGFDLRGAQELGWAPEVLKFWIYVIRGSIFLGF